MTKDALKRLIGDNIRKERISRSMTVDELAELLELTPGFVGLIERGRRGATVHNLYKLSEIFGVDIDRFTVNKNKPSLRVSEKNRAKTKRTKITSLIYQLDEPELEYIIAMIKNLKILKKGLTPGNPDNHVAISYDEPINMSDDVAENVAKPANAPTQAPAEPDKKKKEIIKVKKRKKTEE